MLISSLLFSFNHVSYVSDLDIHKHPLTLILEYEFMLSTHTVPLLHHKELTQIIPLHVVYDNNHLCIVPTLKLLPSTYNYIIIIQPPFLHYHNVIIAFTHTSLCYIQHNLHLSVNLSKQSTSSLFLGPLPQFSFLGFQTMITITGSLELYNYKSNPSKPLLPHSHSTIVFIVSFAPTIINHHHHLTSKLTLSPSLITSHKLYHPLLYT